GLEAELAARAAAIAHPLLEELVQLVARQHHGAIGGAPVELRAERRRFYQAARQMEAKARALSHRAFGEHDELFERVRAAVVHVIRRGARDVAVERGDAGLGAVRSVDHAELVLRRTE